MTAASDRSYPGLARFEPCLDILPPAQRALWPRLAALPVDAVLYGGTALAIRLGRRTSVDFDLFLPLSAAAAGVDRIPIMGAYGATVSPLHGQGGDTA